MCWYDKSQNTLTLVDKIYCLRDNLIFHIMGPYEDQSTEHISHSNYLPKRHEI